MTYYALSLLVLVFSLSARADLDFHRPVEEWNQTIRNYGPKLTDLLTFADVRHFVEKHDVKNVREFVAAMNDDEAFKPFLGSYVLMHHSQSAQRESVDTELGARSDRIGIGRASRDSLLRIAPPKKPSRLAVEN